MIACWHVEVRVQREDGRHRWMRSRPLTMTQARRAATEYKGLGFTARICCDEERARSGAGATAG